MTQEQVFKGPSEIGEMLRRYSLNNHRIAALAEITAQYFESADTQMYIDESAYIFDMMNEMQKEACELSSDILSVFADYAKSNEEEKEGNDD